MKKLKEKFEELALPKAREVKSIIQKYGSKVVGQYNLEQVFDGMKGINGLVTDTSKLDPNQGIRFRGYSIPDLLEQLPKEKGTNEPYPEGIFYLMLLGELPDEDDVHNITASWGRRSNVPKYVFDMIDAFPLSTHPMTLFSASILAMQNQSVFAQKYREGLNKKEYWDPTYEDAMNLIARLPRIAAYIYRRLYKNGEHIEPRPELDWAANFAHMLGYGDNPEFVQLMRLYLTIHADHEGGNVSAHTTHLVGSALSDPYLAFSAGMNGLAGPLHGLANQEVIRWIMNLKQEMGDVTPTKKDMKNFVKKTLESGQVIPGYGHAVLRVTDPRYIAQREFALKHLKDDELFHLVGLLFEVVPPILMDLGKVKNPWPNVDAHSGVLLVHYGFTESDFYTVLFGVSRALGVMSSLIWDRAMGLPLERPNSVTVEWIKRFVEQGG